jgi:hypothetical protein
MSVQALWILIAIVVIVAVLAYVAVRRMRTEQLRRRFGAEYARTVRETGSVTAGESRLRAREKRVERLHIRRLSSEDADRFEREWKRVQTRFVDDPEGAVTDADRLVGEVMAARGYPLGDFDQRAEDISVDHPNVLMHYRAARDIAQAHTQGHASTEDLRQAMVHYRALFSELLERADTQARPDIPAAAEPVPSHAVAERRR